jgi:hypothetical protein
MGDSSAREEDALVSEVLEEAKRDWVGLWRIVRGVQALLGGEAPPGNVRSKTISVCRRLLTAGLAAGQFSSDQEFLVWDSAPDETLRRIQEEWDELGRTPTIGDICWFVDPTASADSTVIE